MRTILLTGATGFLGSYLLDALLEAKYKVIILKRSTSNTWRINHLLSQVKSYDIDRCDLEVAFYEQDVNVVIHTASCYGRNNEPISEIVGTNLMLGLRLLDASIKYNTDSFFNTDTFFNIDTLIQKHLNTYTLSKKQLVEWLRQASDKVQVVNLKLQHVYGPKDDLTKFVPWVVEQLKKEVSEIKLTSGKQQRDFIYIDDVISAYMTALKKSELLPRFSEYDVGTGHLVSVKVFIKKLEKNYEKQFGAIATQLSFGAVPLRAGEMLTVDVDNSALIALGWQPKNNLEQGLNRLLRDS